MSRWILTDKGTIANELSPSVPAVICVDKTLSKWLLKIMNEESESDKKIALLKEDIKDLKRKILGLNQKLDRRNEYIEKHKVGVPVRTEVEPSHKPARKHGNYKEKMCPGAGERKPHLFKPNSGKQTMCSECRAILNNLKKSTGTTGKGVIIRTSWRGTPNVPGRNVIPEPKIGIILDKDIITPKEPIVQEQPAVKKLSVEEVLRMEDGPEKKALEAKFTLSEKIEAAKLRNKIEREKWKSMRNRGFSLDNSLMGVEINN